MMFLFCDPGLIALLGSALFAAGLSVADAAPVTFPGKVTSLQSRNGEFELLYSDPGPNIDGIHEYILRLRSRKSIRDILTFTRSVEVSWSPDSKDAYVNDFIGSNISDCLIVKASEASGNTFSVTKLLFGNGLQSPTPPPPETPENSHFSLSCGPWKAGSILGVDLIGHTDAGSDFSYKYGLNVQKKTIWLDQK